MGVTLDSRYGDSMERVLYNTVLGALPMKPDGTAFYYADYNSSGSKKYFEYRCPCCSGTLGQMVADYGISAYLLHDRGAVVNLYVPSRLTWRQNGRAVSLQQSTAYPLDGAIEIALSTATPETFSVTLRIPAWAGGNSAVSVNGKRVPQSPSLLGSWHEIRRTWNDGDRVALILDTPLRLEMVDAQHPDLVALMRGPLALFAIGDRPLPFTRRELLSVRQVAARSSEWRVVTADGAQSFKPYYALGVESTRLYQPVCG